MQITLIVLLFIPLHVSAIMNLDAPSFPKIQEEVGGLELRFTEAAWSKKEEIRGTAVFRWTKSPDDWRLGGSNGLTITYWDEKKKVIIDTTRITIDLSQDFRDRKAKLRLPLILRVPKECRFILISFGTIVVAVDVQKVGPS
jgi:hypothetical protein